MAICRFTFTSIFVLILSFIGSDITIAQSTPDRQIIGVAREEGQAYIYHAEQIPLSHGYNIYRSDDGEEWNKLNTEPIFPARDGYDLEYRLQEQFELAQQLTGREDPQAVYMMLRSSSGTGILANFASPEIAENMGRLFIDEEAPVGEEVFYRFEIVNDVGESTDRIIEGRVNLEVVEPPVPNDLTVENRGRTVDLNWSYVPNSNGDSRYVIRFQILYRKTGDQDWIPFNQQFLARTTQTVEFKYTNEVPVLGQQYEFVVHAVDFTGLHSESSNLVQINVSENTAPDIVRNIQITDAGKYTSRITWPVSTELDLEGYHVYRARDDEEEYLRITTELLPPLQTVYEDSVSEPGHQYRYKVTASDTSGNESELSNPVNIYIEDERIPDPVTTVEASLIENKVASIIWENGVVPGGLKSYQVLRREITNGSEGLWNLLNSDSFSDNSYEDTGIGGTRFVEGTTVEYGIAVVSENGNISDTVTTALKIPDITPPEAPSLLEVNMQEGRRVGITWNASTSGDVINYRIYKKITNIGDVSDSLIAEVQKGERYFRDDNVQLFNTYTYSVSAVDSVGNESTTMISDTLLTRSTNAPDRVRNVQVVKMENGVVLAWETGDENGLNGYAIYRSGIATGVYEKVGTVEGASGNRWTDTTGEAGNWYKVHAIDKSGRESRSAKATQAIEKH